MDLDAWLRPVIDPEVEAFVRSLVNALGGTGPGDNGKYVLGDDALACLRDLKRWLKLYDNKTDRLDVARCLAEANVVQGDLLEIIASLPEDAKEHTLKYKVAVASLELLVHLTWPIRKDDLHKTANHHQHIPYLQKAQLDYKRAILHHDSANILRTVVRVGLPAMAKEKTERAARDTGIINLVLHLVSNIAQISQAQRSSPGDNDHDISRSATIEAFAGQDIFPLLLTVASNITTDFDAQDVIVVDTLFHLLRGVDAERLFMEKEQLATTCTAELKGLLRMERATQANNSRNTATRHGRFGTMLWVKRDEERVSTLSGQEALSGTQQGLAKMDQSKVWKRPQYRGKRSEDKASGELDFPVPLTASARKHLRTFVEDFLDSSFNPLFAHIRRVIEREAVRIDTEVHRQRYFYLVSWFLHAECVRRLKRKSPSAPEQAKIDAADNSFQLVASVLNQETFILLNRYIQESLDMKDWQHLYAGMKCFTLVLLTVQEMAESGNEDDQDIAENIQNRIFYEQSTHDRVLGLLRSYKDQGFGYLDACTELTHVFMKMLERYAKQNVDLQVHTRRRARKRKAVAQQIEGSDPEEENLVFDAEDVAEAQRTTSERKFDFTRFAARFTSQSCIETFVAFLKFYKDLNDEQLKRAHRFLHRAAFRMEMSVILFRVDIVSLLNDMVRGPEGLDSGRPIYKEWEEFTRQIFRRLVKTIGQRMELPIEMLFSKIPATMFYLEHGYDRERTTRVPRAPAVLDFRPGMTRSEQFGVAVSVLINQSKADALKWMKEVLSSAIAERQSWEDMTAAQLLETQRIEDATETVEQTSSYESSKPRAPAIVVNPDNDERRITLFRDNKLRLLLTLSGFERLGLDDEPDATWIIPSAVSAASLREALELISQSEFSPPTYDDGKSAEDFLRNKAVTRRGRAAYDDDASNASSSDDDGLFPAGPPAKSRTNALEQLKSQRRSRRNRHTDDLDDDDLQRLREERRKNEAAKRKRFKSDIFVHDSDDEEDEERDRAFFAAEEERRRRAGTRIAKAMLTTQTETAKGTKRKPGVSREVGRIKRMKIAEADDSDEGGSSRESSVALDVPRFASEEDDEDATSTPNSSQPTKGDLGAPLTKHGPFADTDEDEDEDELEQDSASQRLQDSARSSYRKAETGDEKDAGETEKDDAPATLETPSNTKRKTANTDDEEDDVPLSKARRGRVRAAVFLDSDSD